MFVKTKNLRGPTVIAVMALLVGLLSPVAAAQDHGGDLDAPGLRVTLERQLGQHVVLATEAMRAGVTGSEDFDAAAAALDRNTQELTGSIEAVYGADGAEAFEGMWSDHIDFFVQYTVGVAEDDTDAQDEALERLDAYREDFGAFLEEATEGQVSAGEIAEGLQVHVDQLVTQIDAFAEEDYDTAFTVSREAFGHMFMTAQALAGAITGQFPDEFDGDLEGHGIDLQSDLGLLLSEHAALAIQAMRAGVDGDPQFEAADAALMANTQDLTAAIEGIYGADAAEAFMQMWQDHIDFFVQYTVGLAEDDQQAQDAALERLDAYRQDFSAFLEEATDGNVPADGAAEGLQVHVDDLVDQIDLYHAGDFEGAYDSAYSGYTHMYDVAQILADGIAAQMMDDMPEGGVATGGGGTATN